MFKSIILKQVVKGFAKLALGAIGSVLVSRGLVDEATSQELIGSALVLITGIWSAVDNTTKIKIPKEVVRDDKVVAAINKTDDPFTLPPH